MNRLLAILLPVILIYGCNAEETETDQARVNTIEDREWVLTKMPDAGPALPEDNPPSLRLNAKDQQINGFGGCNRFFGTYKLAGNQFDTGPLGSTRMSCGDLDLLEFEFFKRLDQADRWELDGRVFRLFLGDESLLYFQSPE